MSTTYDVLQDLSQSISIPQEFYDVIPFECPFCGTPTVITETLRGLSCADPRCISKISMRTEALARKAGFKGLAYKSAEKFHNYYGSRNPLDIFSWAVYNSRQDQVDPRNKDTWGEALPLFSGQSPEVSQKLRTQVLEFMARPISVDEYLALAHLPNVQNTTAAALCEGVSSVTELYDNLNKDMYGYISGKLHLGEGAQVRVGNIAYSLAEFSEDLLDPHILGLFEFINVSELTTLTLVISDSAGHPFKSKKDFQLQASALAADHGFHLNFGSSVTKKTDILIHAGGRETNKYKQAIKKEVPIMTGSDFMSMISQASEEVQG